MKEEILFLAWRMLYVEAKAAIYTAGGILQEARAKHPGHVVAGCECIEFA